MKTKKIQPSLWKNPRFLAMQTLLRVESGNAYSNLLLNAMLKKSALSALNRGLYTEIVYGTLARKLTLDYFLQPFLIKAKKVELWVQILLQVSLYQMLYLTKVPDHAVLNDAVEIAKIFGNEGIGKFINAVLRSIQRQGVPSFDLVKEQLERLSLEVSLPLSLVNFLVNQDGVEETRKLGLSLLHPAHASARLDTRRISIDQALSVLQGEGIKAKSSRLSSYGVVANKGCFAKSVLFKEGKLTIQDESSMLVAEVMQIKPHHQVLDACAAPGGKTTHIATFLDAAQGGKVTALDLYPHKVQLIEENVQRMKVQDVVEVRVLDAREAATVFPAKFDRVLVDAPCSGLGLMRRKPDIKYMKKPADFKQLQKVQLAILDAICSVVKKKGIMVYSTCTIVEMENAEVVQKFLQRHPEFEKINVPYPVNLKTSLIDKMLKIYPQQYGTDGFFISCFQKH